MLFSHLPLCLATAFLALACHLQKRSAQRLPTLLLGLLFARGRRTCTSWFRAAGITNDFRPSYNTLCAAGRVVSAAAVAVLQRVEPLVVGNRLVVAIDDTPTARYGPCIEGAGLHHNPTPGPAGEKYVYGHNWVTLAALVAHPRWGTLALPLQAQLYIRRKDIARLPPERPRTFCTKLQLAVEQLAWLKEAANERFQELWVVVDGGYAKKPFLKGAKEHGFKVIGRLRKDAALWSVPEPKPQGRRGRQAIYGKQRLRLALRAGHRQGWQAITCVQYGRQVCKQIKTFLATWRPAEGLIRVVLVKEPHGWLPFFCTDPTTTAQEILERQAEPRAVLEGMADRGAEEQVFKEVKEVWGAAEQQVRNVNSNEGCFNLNLWLYTLVEVWAWELPATALVDRSASPWDRQPRRPSHADKRKALQRQMLRAAIATALQGRPTKQQFRDLAETLLPMLV